MAIENKILYITNPSIVLDEMSIKDTQSDNNKSNVVSLENNAQKLGDIYPFIMINNYMLNPNLIDSFYLNYNGFLPECVVSFRSVDGIFLSKNFPKDRDLISIMIRSKTDEFTPIRQDFLITNVSANQTFDRSGQQQSITITGVLNVPKLYHEFCKGYKDMSSFDCLLEVSDELNLGFSTNIEDTNDIMNWINPYNSYLDFIKSVSNHSYINDDSFIASFIDQYYRLNFINVQLQYNHNDDLDDGLIQSYLSIDYNKESSGVKQEQTKLILSNFSEIETSNNYIQGYSLINNSGNIIINDGYKRILQYYDEELNQYETNAIDTLDSEDSNDRIILRGRKGEDFYQDENKYKWVGYLNSDDVKNCHDNYFHAKIINHQNNNFTKKLQLRINLEHANFNLYKYQTIPIVIVNDGSSLRTKLTQDDENNDTQSELSIDKFLSGKYVILGFEINWNQSREGFYQTVYLSKREWNEPLNSDNISTGSNNQRNANNAFNK